MPYLIAAAVIAVVALVIAVYLLLTRISQVEERNLGFIDERKSTGNPAEYLKNLAYSQNVSLKYRCRSRLFIYMKKCLSNLWKYHNYLREIPEKLVNLVPAVQWLIDNYYVIVREARIVRQNYNYKYCKKTPKIKGGPLDGYPRIYSIAREILKITDYHCDEDDIIKLLNEYQSVKPLTIAELWAFPNVIKINLTERIDAISRDAMRSLSIKYRVEKVIEEITAKNMLGTEEFIRRLSQRIGREDLSNPKYIAHILYLLKELDIDDSAFKQWIGSKQGNKELDLTEIIRMEAQHQASLQVKMSSAFSSLIEISTINWEGVFEKISVIERTLSEDVAGIYTKMDFATRNLYHQEVEKISQMLCTEEIEVAKKALELSKKGLSQNNEHAAAHVGFYLLGRGKKHLKSSMACEPRLSGKLKDFVIEYRGLLYFIAILIITLILSSVGMAVISQLKWYIIIPAGISIFILSYTVAAEAVNYLTSRMSRPSKLPNMDFEKGIPEEYRTVVIMPVIIANERQSDKYFDSLETYYLANKDKNLYFALLGDFRDADKPEMPEDEAIIERTKSRVEQLNGKYTNDKHSPFIFMSRFRKWNEKQNCWMGWERKRGKLEEFNRLVLGNDDTSYNVITCSQELLRSFKYAITIDADTELTKESAVKLIGKMAHPLNKPVFNKGKTKVIDGYTLLQPRVGIRMRSALATIFSRTFSGQAGINPYINAISDVYQDNFTEGIFSGKGIYDIRIFSHIMDNTLPENAVLSHDLLEGSYVRCALVTDIQLMDGYPSSVLSFFKREHRWIRGDWQLLPWILGRDSLGLLSRYKMLDNLRRSLIPVAQLSLILVTVMSSGINSWFWLPLVTFSMLFSLLVNIGNTVFLMVRCNESGRLISNFPGALFDTIKQGVLLFMLIPFRAVTSLDAILRTIFRLYFSKKMLLEWQTAEAAEKKLSKSLGGFVRKMWAGSAASILSIYAAISGNYAYNMLIAVLWLTSPLIAYIISMPSGEKRKKLPRAKLNDIHIMARKTWRYFEELFDEKDNWLSPDNYQISPGNIIAHRASPTNIGLQLTATLSARDLGYIGLQSMVERLEKIFGTLNRMEKWNGHFYNWYNTRSLDLLYPHYVSTVDSGNLYAYLIVLKNGLLDELKKPLLNENLHSGLSAAMRILGLDNSIMPNTPHTTEEWRNALENWTDTLNSMLDKASPEHNSVIDSEWAELFRKQCESIRRDIELAAVADIEDGIPSLNELDKQGAKRAKMLAERILTLVSMIEKMLEEMDFKPLYDERRHLFRVGLNVSAGAYDQSYYDLLASEARLTSFIAIARGDVPQKHWFKMGRPLTNVRGSTTLISWSGTMFEYLLPNLVMRQVPGTIIAQSNRNAIQRQIEYAGIRNVPWGISESAYYRFDMNLNYQYRAFGIPDLGFRSDLRKSLVVSPYSTMLALTTAPAGAYKNLKVLSGIGAEGKYGYYEALDFLSPKVRNKSDKTKYKLIQSYMIHHQGMSLASMNNYLNWDILIERFHKEPMIRGTEVLLEETRPYGIIVKKEHEKAAMLRSSVYTKKSYESRIITTTRTKYPVAHILSNNNYTTMFTSGGDGFSTWKDIAVNRWTPLIGEHYGTYFYIRDLSTGKYWSAGYQPTMVEPDEYSSVFSPDRVEYRRLDDHIETRMLATISPQEDVEVRRLTLTNRSAHTAKLDVTSYFEPVIDIREADMAHPAFSKLFVSTEYYEKGNILLATRRPRSAGQKRVYVMHAMAVKGRQVGAVEYETNRNRFIGRGNSASNPHSLENDLPLSNTSGNVLDPIMSLRANVTLLPGRSATITYITGAASSKEKALELGLKLQKDYAIEDVFKLALFDSELEMQYLGLSAKQVNSIQDLIGSIYYPSRLMRGPLDAIERNRLGQSALWKFGISGDIPIILFRINDEQQLDSLKDAISSYEYMRKNNVKADFVILNEEREDYYQSLNQRINDIINNRKIYYPHSREARIFLIKARNLTEDETNLMLAVSRIVLSDRNRLLSRRVRRQLMEFVPENNKPVPSYRIKKYSSPSMPQEELKFFNGIGGYSGDGKEYVIYLSNGQNTPAPWSNIVTNGRLGFIITATGGGYTWTNNSRENKLSVWSNDPVTDPPSEVVYLKDESTGEVFTVTPAPVRERETYKIRHGMGYSVFEHNSRGLGQKMYVYLSERDPVKIYRVSIENISDEERDLSLYLYVD
ncbi:MAG: glucoamylase family protein, partial [Eubacteriales bacterium]|nr:glucoamylase family protein [Eubacteriales bacterium]